MAFDTIGLKIIQGISMLKASRGSQRTRSPTPA